MHSAGGRLVRGSHKTFRDQLSIAPLGARLQVFRDVAKSKGQNVQMFTRRLRGMLKNGKTNRVTKSHKTFFEVLPETKELFRESMGENVIWFAAPSAPNHLHTLVADQGGGTTLTHNTYGAQMKEASIPRMQYMAPAQINNAQMARFTKYLNAGVEAGQSNKKQVYGFKNSRGKWIYETACTNWATSAPIGGLQRWAKRVDTQVIKAAKSGGLGVEFKDGLHSALSKAADGPARQALLKKALKAPGMSNHTKASARRLVKEFDVILKNFPKRPPELVARKTLSEIMGVSRSQDPAKWMYDLMLSKNVPVVGVIATEAHADFKNMEFDLQIMGKFNAKGNVVKSDGYKKDGLGIIPPERGGAPVATATN
ncbi:MAG: hypothetical protein GY811_25370 [Myxococcales bacterium]|nr:hypothetical protein [Myxococcales bacterium]